MSADVYIGKSLKRALEITNGVPTINTNLDVIDNSILDILGTPIGTRFYLREYGCRINELIFEPNDNVLKILIRHFVREALVLWEKRVRFEDIQFEQEEATLICYIAVNVIATNKTETFVYPFYRKLNN